MSDYRFRDNYEEGLLDDTEPHDSPEVVNDGVSPVHSMSNNQRQRNNKGPSDQDYYSDVGFYINSYRKEQRAAKKRADIQANARFKKDRIKPTGEVWAACVANEIMLPALQTAARRRVLSSSKLELHFDQFLSDVFFGRVELKKSQPSPLQYNDSNNATEALICLFKFGAIVAWDLPAPLQGDLIALIEPFMKDSLPENLRELDRMSYVWAFEKAIDQDVIHLTSKEPFERLAYSYAFAQSCKLSVFEGKVEGTIDRTRAIPENLAKTGTINARREEISKQIGELFLNRFHINLQTDILDTPDAFWEFEEYGDYYTLCRAYLEIPKRVELLNQRLDIMKDLYDMLNQELSLQHGYKLEWIVIYLIIVEVAIEVIWDIIIRDLLKLV